MSNPTVRVVHDTSPAVDLAVVLTDLCRKPIGEDRICCRVRKHIGGCLPAPFPRKGAA